nr:V-type ATPase subunit [uncultured Acetobacterium sp.]
MSKSKYACINAKTLAMSARRLNDHDFSELVKDGDLKEVFHYLWDHTYYADFIKLLDPKNLHRSDLEVRLNYLKVQEIEKLLYYLSGPDKSFIKVYLVRLEVESLRILIRGIARKEALESLRDMMVYSKNHTKVPFDRLLRVKDWDEFKKLLVDTDYYRIFEIHKELETEAELVMIEKKLDRYYYDLLRNRLFKLDKKSNRDLIEVQQRHFDLLNLVWMYRGKKFYNLSREEILAYSLRGGLKLNEQQLGDLAGAKNVDEMKAQLVDSDYAFLFNHTKTIDLYMERRQERYLYYLYKRLFSDGGSSLAQVVAYIRLLDFEVEDITSIIESKRYRMGETETKKYLIRSLD